MDVIAGRCAAAVTAVRCDTGSAEEVAAVVGACARRRGVPPVTSVLVSGGVLADALLPSQTAGMRTLCISSLPCKSCYH
jgi:nicotinic acid phosphoribosyltransferase